jgi:hypothetical protein
LKLVITTQYHENYGAHDWDGEGDCPQYWKPKGGISYFVPIGNSINDSELDELVKKASAQVTRFNDYVEEYVINVTIERDDYLTPFEKEQLEYDGEIKFPARRIEV